MATYAITLAIPVQVTGGVTPPPPPGEIPPPGGIPPAPPPGSGISMTGWLFIGVAAVILLLGGKRAEG